MKIVIAVSKWLWWKWNDISGSGWMKSYDGSPYKVWMSEAGGVSVDMKDLILTSEFRACVKAVAELRERDEAGCAY
ncbi:MAG TPA: hypothetical protein VNF51_02890 [Candidatus Paceibacterota bacterium]|nr:hypothetical protein [Candidatus Paceibacterota bacterium]